MDIAVVVKLVPDLVEELAIDESGAALDTSYLRLIVNELDNHAVEQAILLKESAGGQVTVIAPDLEGVDDILFTAAAKGADRLIKLTGAMSGVNNYALSNSLAAIIREIKPHLVLTGVQANNDLDGSVGPRLAALLGMAYVGYVSGVTPANDSVKVRKEYSGGLVAQVAVRLPAVLGIQAAGKPPRYVPISKIRQMSKTARIKDQPAGDLDAGNGAAVKHMFKPEMGTHATMIEGEADEVADRLIAIFKEQDIL
ncbi:MAG: electron transfer flavoprotein subunit beta/FixA family protein [Chloroflexi bacterium]|nr:electron transfer flavoprotein subunit beta/FixA family protein [Chloroflexota bacterium]MCL5274291.1 electron transfer flavoprotein subunit beta/FixA family protein [Chloroflexota bacterium]